MSVPDILRSPFFGAGYFFGPPWPDEILNAGLLRHDQETRLHFLRHFLSALASIS